MKLLDHPDEFKTGIRTLLLVLRNKDGAASGPVKKMVSYSHEEFDEVVTSLLSFAATTPGGYRLYGSVDSRDFRAAQREFSLRKVNVDFTPEAIRFYRDLKNQWMGSLSQNSARASKLFLFDVDDPSEVAKKEVEDSIKGAHLLLKEVEDSIKGAHLFIDDTAPSPLIYSYQTKNGWHVITRPFDVGALPPPVRGMCKTNAMMLWGF